MKLTICALISLALCLRVDGSSKAVPAAPEVDDLSKIAEVKKSPEAQRKRDAVYSYRPSEPSRPRLVETWSIRGRPTTRTSGQSQGQVRPFVRYGPPRSQTPQRTETGEVRVTGMTLGFIDDGRHQRVPSPVRENPFAGASPIASQNNVPFGQNSANYLPPRNQQLPVYSSSPLVNGGFAHQHRHHQASAQHHRFQSTTNQELPVRASSQISDGVNFLSQNSQAIEQLYEAPAINVNYEPIHEPQLPRDLQSLEAESEAGSYRNGDFRLPGYASGVLDREALGSVKALEKDRLINELRQSLAARQPGEAFPRDDRKNAEHRGACAPTGPSFVSMTSGYQYVPPAPSSPGTSGSSVSPATSQEVTAGQATTGQSPTSVSATSTANFQFPNFGTLVPVTSYLDYPAYGAGFLASGTSGQVQTTSPTQFGIPIPQGTLPIGQKPTTSGTPSNTLPVPVQPLHPVLGAPTSNFSPAAIQPSFPLVPAVGQNNLAHPVHGIQPSINPLLVKPVKPLYPLYYYPNVYQLQKPGLANVPWNYAPSYSPARPEQAWK